MKRIKYYFTLIGIFLGLFYGFGLRKYEISSGFNNGFSNGLWEITISLFLIILLTIVMRFISKFSNLKKEIFVPIDTFVSRGIELLNSIPRLILIITISAVVEPSIWIVMVIIWVTGWTGIARFTRAEFLRIRSLEYIQALQSLGFSC